jgi:ketosteroid isomerase-like protein
MGTGKDLWKQMERLSNNQGLAGVGSLFTRDAVYVAPYMRREGSEAIGAYFAASGEGRSDFRMKTSLVIEEGDTVVAEWTSRSTNTGPLTMPDGTEIPPTGKTLELPGVTVATVRDGKFATMRHYFDTVDIARQLGLMPST